MYTFIFCLIIAATWPAKDSCENLPHTYRSVREAEKIILASSGWEINEFEFTNTSTWMKGAYYRSCDGNLGYLIIQTDYDPKIHSSVEARVWREFKSTSIKDRFYHENIEGKYKFRLLKPEEQ